MSTLSVVVYTGDAGADPFSQGDDDHRDRPR